MASVASPSALEALGLSCQVDLSTRDARERADIELVRGLVAIESLSGGEGVAVAFLRAAMAARGFRILEDPAGNAVGTVGRGDRHVVLLGHIDTVPGRIPVRIEDDVLWGRGAVDAKGPLATFVAAASAAAERLKVRVTVVGAVGEEVIGSPGANQVAKWPAPDFCLIGEPSGWAAICLGYRGSLSLIYTLQRSTRHTAGPGHSVAEEAVGFWNDLLAELGEWNAEATNRFGAIGYSLRKVNTTGDGLTDVATLSIGLRLPPGVDVARLLSRIRLLAGDGTIEVDGLQEGYRTDKRSKLVPPFLRAIRAEGGAPRFTLKLGTSDMNVVGPVWNCPIIAYGPGDSALDHTPDERLDLGEYLRAIRVLAGVLEAL
jgi:LysW-gamma-L-lysine carboxypeptidase